MTMGEPHAPRIRLRLTIMYAASLLVLLVGSATVIRFAMRAALEREFDQSIRSSAELVSQFFRVEIGEYQTIDGTLSHIATELVFEDRALHIHQPDGQEFTVVGDTRAKRSRVIAAPVRHVVVPLDAALAPGWTVEVEASGAGLAAVESRLDRWIAWGIPALVVLAAFAGWWLTGRTLRPVGLMADAAARIDAGSGGRIPVSDATDELGRLGTRFNALLDRLDVALEQQRRFIADAAHELRTPLARVRSRVEVAMLPAADASPGPHGASPHGASPHGASPHGASPHGASPAAVLPAVQDELVRMSRLVDELLQLARADSGRDTAVGAMPLVFVDDVVTDELRRWHADAERAGITLRCSQLIEAPIHGDAVLLGRLIGILVDNALRYGRRGGSVDVRVSTDASTAVLEVEDDGIGIAPDEQGRIFERFYRGARARAQRPDGSGLGLAIAHWIVERHTGSITYRTGSRDVGTLVAVRLPLRGSPRPAANRVS
jgi:two-component system, OmpR family, sensor kinase